MELKIKTRYYGEVTFLIDAEDAWIKDLKSLYALPVYGIFEGQIKHFYLMSQAKMVSRMIMDCPSDRVVRCVNGTHDIRKKHLIICRRGEVARFIAKKQPGSSSKYIGVHFHKSSKRWVALIRANKQQIYLGSFKDEIKAAKEYNKATIKYHGKHAKLNYVR